MKVPVYLDHNATTAIDSRVFDAMMPWLQDRYGNPSSGHSFGQTARSIITTAREYVAELVNAHPSQVIFTSGGSEANNLAIKGIAAKHKGAILFSAVEHASVVETVKSLDRETQIIAVDADGLVNQGILQQALTDTKTTACLMSVMLANNETGVIQAIASLATLAKEQGVMVHTDAVQAVGKIEVDFKKLGVHFMSLSAHKIYGPKGAGALIVDKTIDTQALLHGGSQEHGYRAGTENVAAIVGFAKAAELAQTELVNRNKKLLKLRQQLEHGIKQYLPKAVIFAEQVERLPNTVFMAVPGIDGETLLMNLDQSGLAIASGSACESASVGPSHVLMAMGVEENIARCAIRISLGKDNTEQEVEYFLQQIKQQVQMLQSLASVAIC